MLHIHNSTLSIPTMMNFVSCLFFVSFAIGSIESSDVRIVGGSTAPDGAYPYQVSMRIRNFHFCGGSIISKRCILTAAHCLQRMKPRDINIVVGTNLLNETGDKYPVETIYYHQNFTIYDLQNDVGLALLEKDIEFNKTVQPIDISWENILGSNVTATLAGWGRMMVDGYISNALQHINLTVLTREQCEFPEMNITESHLCTLNKEGEGACNGDSGGPLVSDGKQIGIVSFGVPCAQGFPDVYTRVATFMDWIQSHCPGI